MGARVGWDTLDGKMGIPLAFGFKSVTAMPIFNFGEISSCPSLTFLR